MVNRRQLFSSAGAAVAAAAVGKASLAALPEIVASDTADMRPPLHPPNGRSYQPVATLNGWTLPWRMQNGVKEFHLVAEAVTREIAPGMKAHLWGYNGQSPGPTIEVVEGDRVRMFVTNRLLEPTSIHWHGQRLPNGMDGVSGLTQPSIKPGQTYVYEFTAQRSGTFMYHPHADDMTQMAMGMMGFWVTHPRDPRVMPVDRDYVFLLNAYDIDPGIRVGNLTMTNHPIHLHGHEFVVTGTDGGWIPASARMPEVTTDIGVGQMKTLEFSAAAPGDWVFHCHKSHHTMNAMGHAIPNTIGVEQRDLAEQISSLVPNYMNMSGEGGTMGDMQMQMPLPPNTLPMMTGTGPHGSIEMGGMFTLVKIRADLAHNDYRDPGWYQAPKGSVAYLWQGEEPPLSRGRGKE